MTTAMLSSGLILQVFGVSKAPPCLLNPCWYADVRVVASPPSPPQPRVSTSVGDIIRRMLARTAVALLLVAVLACVTFLFVVWWLRSGDKLYSAEQDDDSNSARPEVESLARRVRRVISDARVEMTILFGIAACASVAVLGLG